MLTSEEFNRYDRHILLPEIGLDGQLKLKNARVLIIGAGGLGCPIIQYLVAAGVGKIGIIDFDTVDESNLQRQIIYNTNDIGKSKAEVAKAKMELLNPEIEITAYNLALNTSNALSLFEQYDVIIDGSDNFSTRYLVCDACIYTNKPLVYGAIFKFEGQVSVFNLDDSSPSYRCLFPTPPAPGSVPNCSEIGVLGVLPGIIGSYQANETLKIILGIGNPLSGKLLTINTLTNSNYSFNITRNNEVINEVLQRRTSFESFDYDHFCGIDKSQTANTKALIGEISATELRNILDNEDLQILDVRQPFEQPKITELNAINIPLDQLENRTNELNPNQKTIVFCQHGIRSQAAIEILEENGFNQLYNLTGGIVRW